MNEPTTLAYLCIAVLLAVVFGAIFKQRQPQRKPRKQRDLKHGSRGKYGRDKCRCIVCEDAHEARKVARRNKIKTLSEGEQS